jgi:hypothetical protein
VLKLGALTFYIGTDVYSQIIQESEKEIDSYIATKLLRQETPETIHPERFQGSVQLFTDGIIRSNLMILQNTDSYKSYMASSTSAIRDLGVLNFPRSSVTLASARVRARIPTREFGPTIGRQQPQRDINIACPRMPKIYQFKSKENLR